MKFSKTCYSLSVKMDHERKFVLIVAFLTIFGAKISLGINYNLEYFDINPGIYFEYVGTLSTYNSKWNLITHSSIFSFFERDKFLENYYEVTSMACSIAEGSGGQNYPECRNLLTQVWQELDKIKLELEHLAAIAGNVTTQKNRGKISNVTDLQSFKKLFGNLDSTDAEYYDTQIRSNQNPAELAAAKQTNVHRTSLTNLKNSFYNFRFDEKILKHKITRLQKDIVTGVGYVTLRDEFEKLFQIFTSLANDLRNDINSAIEYLVHIQKGALYPNVLSPDKIIKLLKPQVDYLSPSLKFPVTLVPENANLLTRFIELKAYYINYEIVMIVEIPILEKQVYILDRMIPLPAKVESNLYGYLDMEKKLTAIDADFKTYLNVTEEDLKKCKKVIDRYVCRKNYPIYFLHSHDSCEIKLHYRPNYFPENCKVRYVNLMKTLYMDLKDEGRWLFVAPNEEEVRISCVNEREHFVTLKNSGIISLNGKCKFISDWLVLENKNPMKTESLQRDYLPPFNLTFGKIENSSLIKFEKLYASNLELKGLTDYEELNKISFQLVDLEEDVVKIGDQHNFPSHFRHLIAKIMLWVMGTIFITVILVYVVYKIVTLWRCYVKVRSCGEYEKCRNPVK